MTAISPTIRCSESLLAGPPLPATHTTHTCLTYLTGTFFLGSGFRRIRGSRSSTCSTESISSDNTCPNSSLSTSSSSASSCIIKLTPTTSAQELLRTNTCPDDFTHNTDLVAIGVTLLEVIFGPSFITEHTCWYHLRTAAGELLLTDEGKPDLKFSIWLPEGEDIMCASGPGSSSSSNGIDDPSKLGSMPEKDHVNASASADRDTSSTQAEVYEEGMDAGSCGPASRKGPGADGEVATETWQQHQQREQQGSWDQALDQFLIPGAQIDAASYNQALLQQIQMQLLARGFGPGFISLMNAMIHPVKTQRLKAGEGGAREALEHSFWVEEAGAAATAAGVAASAAAGLQEGVIPVEVFSQGLARVPLPFGTRLRPHRATLSLLVGLLLLMRVLLYMAAA